MALTAAQKRLFERRGYLAVPGVLGRDRLDAIRGRLALLAKRWPKLYPTGFRLEHMVSDRFWLRLAADPRLLGLVKPLLRGEPVLFSAACLCKPPGSVMAARWHQDGIFWKLTLWPLESVSLFLAVDDSTAETGCVRMIPGSHRGDLLAHRACRYRDSIFYLAAEPSRKDVRRAVDVELAAGDACLHHPLMIHSSRPNVSARGRAGVLLIYTSTASQLRRPSTPMRVRGLRALIAPLGDRSYSLPPGAGTALKAASRKA